jgi:hypothetical protein
MSDHASAPRRDARPAAGSPRPSRIAGLSATTAARLGILTLIALAAWLGLQSLTAVPAVIGADAPATVFSAERALVDLRALTADPRPVGSPANAAARDYLLAQIAALGLEPQVQQTAVLRHEPGFPETHLMPVENVLIRVPGTETGGKALLVSGHYDSVGTAVGASDCGMCAATTLETLRAVVAAAAAGQPPRNDVIFLFTDAEEIGVAGALGFMRDHPWAADVGLSLVFEALGNDGAPLLYIAGPESGAVVGEALDALGDGAARPLASSFLHDFMWTVAGNTGSDLDAFVEGAPGLGFIYLSLETVAAYHTNADSAANLDPRSVQGMGDFAVTLTRHFANRPLDDLSRSPNLVMFPLWPGMMARYSSALALPLAIAAAALLVVALFFGLRRGALSGRGVLASFAAWLPALLVAVLLASAAWGLVRLLTPHLHNFTAGGWWGSGFYLAAALALGLAMAVAWRGLLRRFAAADLLGGMALWWALLALLTAAALPGLSYLFVWPLLPLAAAMGVANTRYEIRDTNGDRVSGIFRISYFVFSALAAAVAALLFAPVANWLWIYAGRAEAMMGLPMAGLPVLFVWPALALAATVADTRYERRDMAGDRVSGVSRISYLVSFGLIALAAVLFIVPALRQADATRPWANAVVYTLDADSGAAHWVTFNDSRLGRGTRHQIDEWTSQFFADRIEETTFDPWLLTRSDTRYPALQTAAPLVDLPHTVITAAPGASEAGHTRLVVARPPEAWLTQLVVHSAAPITGLTLDGEALDLGGAQPTEYTFLIIGRDDEVIIDLAGADGVTAGILDRLTTDVTAIAAQAGLAIAPRPTWMTTAAASDTADGALVTSRYE